MWYPFLRFPGFKYRAVTFSYDDGTIFDKRLVEICKYVKAYDQLQFSALGDRVYNPTNADIYMHHFGKDVLVKAGQTVKL